jgi:RNA recognition motif-containing protein
MFGHNSRDCPEAKRVRLDEGENDTIFVSGLPHDVTEEDISKHFGVIGTSSFFSSLRSCCCFHYT